MSDDKKRILIMEDSDIFADMLIEFLVSAEPQSAPENQSDSPKPSEISSPDFLIERAVNGFEGIKKVYSFMPHLIVTDIEMPVFKGYQVTRFLKSRKNTAAIPIIMFTSLGDKKDKFWGMHAGADAYIEKSPDNLQPLREAIVKLLSSSGNIDFPAIQRESRKINDETIIEIVNGLLDDKLFQTTVIGKLTELSDKVFSLEMIVRGVFDLLHTICEAEIVTIMLKSGKGVLYVYTANFAEFTAETVNDFSGISVSDFNNLFPDFMVIKKNTEDFFPVGGTKKKIASYATVPLAVGGEKIASVHVANSINDYFTPAILENMTVFLNAAAPVIANTLSLRELADLQQNTRAAFARYVPADVMDEIIDNSSKMVKHSESRNVTVLFSDIRDFTAISEYSSAQNVVNFLNAYFAAMGSIIISEGGHIDKFIGDAIMAIFGAFQNQENPMISAVRAAVKMLAALKSIDTANIAMPQNGLEIGIAINSGLCVLGNIGFQNKMDYTVIGDTVNLASRLEGVTKLYHHPLIVSEFVCNIIKDMFLLRKIDNVRVIGREESIGIYAVYTGYEETEPDECLDDIPVVPSLLIKRDTFENYNKGLQLYYLREWKPAREYFSKASKANENDYLSRLYLERTTEYSHNPPPVNWDGVVTLSEK